MQAGGVRKESRGCQEAAPHPPQGSHHLLRLPLESLPFPPNHLLQDPSHPPPRAQDSSSRMGIVPLFNNNWGAQGRKGQVRESSDLTTSWVIPAPIPDLLPKTLHQPSCRHLPLSSCVLLRSLTLSDGDYTKNYMKVAPEDGVERRLPQGGSVEQNPFCHLTKSFFFFTSSKSQDPTATFGHILGDLRALHGES